jgi:hypothetical protein
MRVKLDAFQVGDRVEPLLFCGFNGESRPQATVIETGTCCVRCKMDRSGKVIRFLPDDLRRYETKDEERALGRECI